MSFLRKRSETKERCKIFGRYPLNPWHGDTVYMTPKAIYKRVMCDKQSNFNWFASASELVKTCQMKDFPEEYAIQIKIAILNCFANIENNIQDYEYTIPEADILAAEICYNSLKGVSKEADETREKYLKAIINSVAATHFDLLDFWHYGKTTSRIRNDWKEHQFEKYDSESDLELKKVKEELHNDYDLTMRAAEEEGKLKKDDMERDAHLGEVMKKMLNEYGSISSMNLEQELKLK